MKRRELTTFSAQWMATCLGVRGLFHVLRSMGNSTAALYSARAFANLAMRKAAISPLLNTAGRTDNPNASRRAVTPSHCRQGGCDRPFREEGNEHCASRHGRGRRSGGHRSRAEPRGPMAVARLEVGRALTSKASDFELLREIVRASVSRISFLNSVNPFSCDARRQAQTAGKTLGINNTIFANPKIWTAPLPHSQERPR